MKTFRLALGILVMGQGVVEAAVSVTAGNNLTFTSAEASTGTWKTISTNNTPLLVEGSGSDFSTGVTYTLTAPAGWTFNTGATVTATRFATSNNADYTATVTNTSGSTITITFSAARGSGTCSFLINNLQLRPGTTSTPSATSAPGTVTVSGSNITGSPATLSMVNIQGVSGTATKVGFLTQPSNTVRGSAISTFTVAVQDSQGYTVATDNSTVITLTGTGTTLNGTVSATAVNGIATFSNVRPGTAGSGKTITAAATSLTSGTSNAFTVTSLTLTSPTSAWKVLQQGSSFDFIDDQQATAADLELVGNATHPVLYSYYDDGGTEVDTDDALFLRARMAGSKSSTSSQFSSGYLFLGFDVDGNNSIDFYLSTTLRNAKEKKISVWGPGTDLNISPSTTSITNEIPIISLATTPANFFDFSRVSTSLDDRLGASLDHNLNTAAADASQLAHNLNDHFVSIKVPFNNSTTAIDTLKEAARLQGVQITKDLPLRLLLATSTQSNSFNSDINGYQGDTKSSVTYADKGVFSQELSLSNAYPVITSNGGGATASIVYTGNPLTTVTATDADGDALSYSRSAGDTDFSIDATTGALTLTNGSKAPGSYSVTVKVVDLASAGGSAKSASSYDTQVITVVVPDTNDGTAPTITSVTSGKTNGSYKTGEVIDISVVFSEPVIVTGSPYLELAVGATPARQAAYQSGSGSSTLIFRYTVQSGDYAPDLDYLATSSLNLNSGTIRDAKPNNANLTLPVPGAANSLSSNKALVIDTTAPVYASGTASGSTVVLSFTDLYTLDANNGPLTTDFTVTVAGNARSVTAASVNSSAKTVTLTLASAATGGQAVVVTYNNPAGSDKGYAIQDIAGNDASFTTSSITASGDSVAPTIVGVTATQDVTVDSVTEAVLASGHYKSAASIQIRVAFSEAIVVTGTPQLTLETGSTDAVLTYNSAKSSGNVMVFDYTVANGEATQDLDYSGTGALALNGGTIKDAGDNNAVLTLATPGANGSIGYSQDIVIDTTSPVFSSAKVNGTSLTLSYTDTNAIDLANPPGTSAFAVNNGGAVTVSAVAVNATTNQIVLTLASTISSGSPTVSYTDPTGADDASAIQDLAGNDAITISNQSVTVINNDTTAPTLTSISPHANSIAVNSPITYTLTFNEEIDGASVTSLDFTATSGSASYTLGAITKTSATTFTVIVTPTTSGTITFQVKAGAQILDLAGNALDTTNASSASAVTVTKLSQTITFASPGEKSLGIAPFALGGTASSGLTVSYTVVSGPATVSGSTMTLVATGTVVVRASQAGNGVYNAASNVDRTFNVVASGSVPEINLRGSGGSSILSGSNSPLLGNSTDFGTVKSNATTVTKTFVIENKGAGTLTITGNITLSGSESGDFSVTQPGSTSIAAAGSTTFTITYTPTTSRDPSRAVVTVPSNDGDEGTYTFAIKGKATASLAPTDITLSNNRVASATAVPTQAQGGLLIGSFKANPDLGGSNSFSLVTGSGSEDDDNGAFYISGNQLRLKDGDSTAGSNDSVTNRLVKSTFNINIQASGDGQTHTKAFVVYVTQLPAAIGDFFVSDRGAYLTDGSVLRLSYDGTLKETYSTAIIDPYQMTTDADGNFIIANHAHVLATKTVNAAGGIHKINVLTGAETQVSVGAPFLTPLGVEVETVAPYAGKYIVADSDYVENNEFLGAIFRVDPTKPSSENKTILSKGGLFDYLQGVALAPNGDIYVTNIRLPRSTNTPQILKVDRITGEQTVLTSGGSLDYPVGLAVEEDGSSLVVADGLAGKLIRVDLATGAQSVVASGGGLTNPTHIAIELDGNYIVTDGRSSTVSRRIFRVDRGTGAVSQIMVDSTEKNANGYIFDQPRGITIAK
jgi:uncharacterized repeat protein (TIGR02059 family)